MIEHDIADPRAVFDDHVKGRRSIYLDTNVWIDLAEGGSDVARETLSLARLVQRSGLAIFPLSYASITEFLKQPPRRRLLVQAHIMDELSEGVSFRAWRHIRALEVRRIYEYMVQGEACSHYDEVFTVTACYLGDASLEYPEGTPPALAAAMTEDIIQATPGVNWFLEHIGDDDYRARYTQGDQEWLTEIERRNAAAESKLINADGTPSAKLLRYEEHYFVFREYVLKLLPRVVGIAAVYFALRRFQSRGVRGSSATLARGINVMPYESLTCEMHIQRRLNRDRPPQLQDFYDYDHAGLGVGYCDAFATSDGELIDLLRRSGVQRRFRSTILRGLPDLRRYLQDCADEKTVTA